LRSKKVNPPPGAGSTLPLVTALKRLQ
jgi:hypothetical protein